MFGVGVTRDGDAMYLSGTSEVLGIISPRQAPTPGRHRFPLLRRHQAACSADPIGRRVACMAVARSWDEMLEICRALVAATPPSASVPLFLPHLQGERAPLWDIKSRGVFARMDSATGPGELSRAVMEGVAFSARLAFEAVESSADIVRRSPEYRRRRRPLRHVVPDSRRRARQGAPPRQGARCRHAGRGRHRRCGLGRHAVARGSRSTGSYRSNGYSSRTGNIRDYYDTKFGKYGELYADLKPFNEGYATVR